jgi:hypothetical protein
VIAAPELFELDDDGLSRALRNEVTGEDIGAARSAELVCPVSAIRFTPEPPRTSGVPNEGPLTGRGGER